jgi:hypothetical protein
MEPPFELKDTVQFYCPNAGCKQAITFRELEDQFEREPSAWEVGTFRCPHCSAHLARKIIRRFETGGFQWIPEFSGSFAN